ncbi:MAG: hypothetical protein Q9160_004185 [Pyrenula sp. 1 TL-2023]
MTLADREYTVQAAAVIRGGVEGALQGDMVGDMADVCIIGEFPMEGRIQYGYDTTYYSDNLYRYIQFMPRCQPEESAICWSLRSKVNFQEGLLARVYSRTVHTYTHTYLPTL